MSARVRTDYVDRAWAGLWSSILVTGVEVPEVDAVRDVIRSFLTSPTSPAPYRSTIDPSGHRWQALPPDGLEGFLERVVVPWEGDGDGGGDGEGDGDAALADLAHRHPRDLPFRLWVADDAIGYTGSHMLGDAASDAVLLRAALDLDPAPLLSMVRLDAAMLRRAVTAQTRTHHREWTGIVADRLRGVLGSVVGSRPETVAASSRPDLPREPGTVTSSVRRPRHADRDQPPSMVSCVLTNADMRRISAWRNAHVRGASVTAVMASLAHRALADVGVELDAGGFFTLVDLRRYLVDATGAPLQTPGLVFGNLAKAVHLDCALDDPRAIDAALEAMVASGRPMAATAFGAGLAAVVRPGAGPAATGGPLTLTYNSIPGLPGASGLPWRGGIPGRYLGNGFPTSGDGLSLIAHKLREHMEMSACVAPGTVDPALVRRALASIPDVAAL